MNVQPTPIITGPDRADAPVREWTPHGIGLPRAVLLAFALVAALLAGLVSILIRTVPPPSPPVTVQLMDAAGALMEPAIAAPPPTSVAAPAPAAMASPTPALSDPPPVMPAEAATLPPLEASPIPIAPPPQAPTPRRQHSVPSSLPVRPIVRPSVRSAPAERSVADLPQRITPPAAPIEQPALSAPVDVKSGLGPYGAGLHRQIERNMLADRRVTELGVSGTAVIEATIAPDGHLISARLARGSGTRAIDDAALDSMRRGGFPPFGPHMPAGPITVQVPIGVQEE